MNEQILQGHWNELKGKIQERWGQLTNDELAEFEGDSNQLVGLIQRKTGETRDAIESYLEECAAGASSAMERARVAAQDFTQQAAESLRASQEKLTENARQAYEAVEQRVHDRPKESLAIAFGVGLVAGVVVALALKPRS